MGFQSDKPSFMRFFKVDPELEKLPFRERWRINKERIRQNGSGAISVKFIARGLMFFHIPTLPYVFIWNIVPYLYEDYGSWTVYYMNVLLMFQFMNLLANWSATILYDPSFPKTKDNPFLESHNLDSPPETFVPLIELHNNKNGLNGHCVYDMTSKEALSWEYCEKCEMHIPPRAHHCRVCKKCVLKRDHHCFLVGNCVGFKNQRYFIMMNFYLMFMGWFGGALTFHYIQYEVWPQLGSWADALWPVAVLKACYGGVSLYHALIVFLVFTELLFGFIGFVYFTSQITMSAGGVTLYEVARKVPIKNNNSMNTNFKSIFGAYWGLNFLFPMTLIFRQMDDGIHWDNVKIDYTKRSKQLAEQEKNS